jgi:hypothetical protein
MNSLIHLFKELYFYCTDFIINLANITGLSYYEVNFIIFIIIYPLLLIIVPVWYLYQKSRLLNLKKTTSKSSNTVLNTSLENIKTFNKRQIFITANIAWLIIIVCGTIRVLTESTNYYIYHLSKGDYPQEADSISIPIFRETFFAFIILSILLIFLNIFIFFTTRKTILPTKLFIKANNYSVPVVLWEIFFGFWVLTTLIFFFYWIWLKYYFEGFITLFFTFILLNIRAGKISNYKKNYENSCL